MITEAIRNLRPTASFSLIDDDYSKLIWYSTDVDIPSKEDVDAEITRLQAEYEAKQYQRDRAVAYPSIQEQLDLLYWDKVNGTDNWEQAIAAVKAEYPKG